MIGWHCPHEGRPTVAVFCLDVYPVPEQQFNDVTLSVCRGGDELRGTIRVPDLRISAILEKRLDQQHGPDTTGPIEGRGMEIVQSVDVCSLFHKVSRHCRMDSAACFHQW